MKEYYDYEVYKSGVIKRNGKELKQNLNNKGYPRISISINGKVKLKFVHKLVAELFITDKSDFKCSNREDRNKIDINKLQVNHKDGNKLNNNVDNLEWCSNLYNREHAIKNHLIKTVPKGDKNNRARKVKMIGENTEKTFGSLRSALEYLNKPYSCYSSLSHCCKGDTRTAYGYKWEYID